MRFKNYQDFNNQLQEEKIAQYDEQYEYEDYVLCNDRPTYEGA